jgi:hypothetical protein
MKIKCRYLAISILGNILKKSASPLKPGAIHALFWLLLYVYK